MNVFDMTQDAETGWVYISLADQHPGIVDNSIDLEREDPTDPESLGWLVLDFDTEGRLVGIEVPGPGAEKALRPELLSKARQI